MNVPPFEEHPYYLNVSLSNDMIDFIVDKLVCFGVRQQFAIEVGEYIKNNTLRSTDELAIRNGWLFFTSGSQYPSNWNSIIKDITNTNISVDNNNIIYNHITNTYNKDLT